MNRRPYECRHRSTFRREKSVSYYNILEQIEFVPFDSGNEWKTNESNGKTFIPLFSRVGKLSTDNCKVNIFAVIINISWEEFRANGSFFVCVCQIGLVDAMKEREVINVSKFVEDFNATTGEIQHVQTKNLVGSYFK